MLERLLFVKLASRYKTKTYGWCTIEDRLVSCAGERNTATPQLSADRLRGSNGQHPVSYCPLNLPLDVFCRARGRITYA